MCVVFIPLPVVPSPKSHEKPVSVWPEPASEADALKKIVSPTAGDPGDVLNVGLGRSGEPIDTCCVVDAAIPRSLVSVSVTTNDPDTLKVWFTTRPAALAPSPKVHANETTSLLAVVQLPLTIDPAVNCAVMFADGEVGDSVMHGDGVEAGGRMTPTGTRRINTDCVPAATKFVPLGVATI